MKIKTILIINAIILIIIIGGFLGIWYGCGYGKSSSVITITQKIPGKPKIIYVPRTNQEYEKCFQSLIIIKAEMITDDLLLIEAADKCKSNALGLELNCKRGKFRRHVLIFTPLAQFEYDKQIGFYTAYGGQISYYYKLTNLVGIGGGITGTTRGGGINAGLLFNF